MKKNSIKYLQKIQLIQLSSIPIKISTVSRNKFKYNLDSQFQNSQTPFNLEITKSLYEIELGLKGLFRNSLKKKKKSLTCREAVGMEDQNCLSRPVHLFSSWFRRQ